MAGQADWVAGCDFTVDIDGTAFPFKTISVHPTANLLNRANSKYSPGFQVRKAGIKSMSISGVGPYRKGELPLVIGGEYTVNPKPDATHAGFETLMLLEDFEFSSDQEGEPNVSVTFQNQQSFGTSFS